MWSWNDADKKHVLGFVVEFWRKVQAYHVNCTGRSLFSSLFPPKRVETIHVETKDILPFTTVRRDKFPAIWTTEILQSRGIPYILMNAWQLLFIRCSKILL